MSRRVKLMSIALVLVVLFSASNVGVYRSAGNAGVFRSAGHAVVVREAQAAIGLVGALFARSIFRTGSMKRAERHDRSNINKRRDEELKEVEYRVQAVAVQE